MSLRLKKLTLLLTFLSIPQWGYSLVGSERVGKGWDSIVYIEFFFNKNAAKISCTGFLINATQAITVGHCAIHDESNHIAQSAAVCIGRQKPFSKPGEGCFQSKNIRFSKHYKFNSPTDMVIIDLSEPIPLNFLGIKPLQLISGIQAEKLITQNRNKDFKIVSFGSRNFNAPSLGKKGQVSVNSVKWNEISGLLKLMVKGSVFGQSDDGAGLLLKTIKGWKLVGLMLKAKPDFFVSIQPFFDPCLPPEPSPLQPDIKITSVFHFASVNSFACNNNFFPKNVYSKNLCRKLPLTTNQIRHKAENGEATGNFALEMYSRSNSSREKLFWLNKASAKGNQTAMLKLAEKYLIGDGLRKNTNKALELIIKAAQKGDANAQYRVGMLLNQADTQIRSMLKGKAQQWLFKAAQQGHAASQFEYAQYLSSNNSKGVYDWLMRSARQGDANAQYLLGYNYYYGQRIKKDRYIGRKWIEYAAGQAHIEASNFLKQHPFTPNHDR